MSKPAGSERYIT